MAIFDILKKELFVESDDTQGEIPIVEEESSINGDPQALVNGMLENAPGSKEQIGVILKYAANSIPNYDIWDAALDYYESLADDVDAALDDVGIGDDSGEEIPPEDGEEIPLGDGGDELPPEDDDEDLSM